MSLDKAIEHGKEKRRKYRDSRAVDRTCRCHGSCAWCYKNRVHKREKEEERCIQELNEYKNYEEFI